MTFVLANAHKCQPGVALCGAPSLPACVAELTASVDLSRAVWASANEHGGMLRRVDYLVAVDLHHQRESFRQKRPVSMGEVLRPLADKWGAMIVSRRPYADVPITVEDLPAPAMNAGIWTIQVLALMGCTPIYVCGMECYQGGTYYHAPDAESSSQQYTAQMFIDAAMSTAQALPDADIRIVGGGLLAQVWPAFMPQQVAA